MKRSLAILFCGTIILLILLSLVVVGQKQKEAFENPIGEFNPQGTLTMYYANWCPHCKDIKPIYTAFMGDGKIVVNGKTFNVRMVEEKDIKKGEDPEVKGYPSFIYSDSARRTVEYDGPRSPEGWMEFLKTKILS
jgi:thiol-disulfide isomerase/thioredoxin